MPEGWPRRSLEELAEVTIGRQRSPKHASGENIVQYLRAANVKDGRLQLDDVLRMNFTVAEQEAYRLTPGDVLVSEGCGSIKELGASARWGGELQGPICFQNTLLRLRARPGVAIPGFLDLLARWLHQTGGWAAVASGTNIFHIGRGRAAAVQVPCPPLLVQRRIVDLIAAVDGFVSSARAHASAAEDVREAIESKVIESARSGDMVQLAEIAEIRGGVTKDAKKQAAGRDLVEVPYLRVANVQRGFLDLTNMITLRVPVTKANQLKLQPGDVLFNEGGDRDKLGRGWVWEGQLESCIHQNHVFRARLISKEFDPYFVSMWGNSFGQRWFEENGTQTTNLASINKSTLSRFPVPRLRLEEQKRVMALSLSAGRLAHAGRTAASSADDLRRILVDLLLSGQHTIPDSYDRLLGAVS